MVIIKVRYLLGLVSFIGFFFNYAYKAALSVTIVEMSALEDETGHFTNQTLKPHQYYWHTADKESLLEAFFYGYLLTQIPSGILAERYSAKWIFGLSQLTVALLSLIFPLACQHSFEAAYTVRVVQGFFQGVTYPVMNAFITRWIPKYERNSFTTCVHLGAPIGSIISIIGAGALSKLSIAGGWPIIYYILGGAGILWFFAWCFIVTDFPRQHPFISDKELSEIDEGIGDEKVELSVPIPWRKIFTSLPIFAWIVAAVTCNWGFLVLLGQLPTYLHDVFHKEINQSAFLSSLPFITLTITSLISAKLADHIRSFERYNLTTVRRIFQAVGSAGSGLCLLAIPLVHYNSNLTVIIFMLSFSLWGVTAGGFVMAGIDMAPTFAATLMGINNFVANLPGIIVPKFVSYLISENHSKSQWSILFTTSGVIMISGAIIFSMFGSSQLQPWDNCAKIKAENNKSFNQYRGSKSSKNSIFKSRESLPNYSAC